MMIFIVFLFIVTTNGGVCVFPFTYLGKQYNKCLASGLFTWCATTSSYDRDKKFGYCNPTGLLIFLYNRDTLSRIL